MPECPPKGEWVSAFNLNFNFDGKELITMILTINPLHILFPAFFVGFSLIGFAKYLHQKREQQLKYAAVKARREHT